MEKQVTIEILGHKAKVAGIKGRLKDGIWRKEDLIEVWFEFDEAVESTLGFGIDLPVKNYGKDEFLEAMRGEGERVLGNTLKRDVDRREQQRQEKIRQGELDSLATQLQSLISK